jgi:hypothetical protein
VKAATASSTGDHGVGRHRLGSRQRRRYKLRECRDGRVSTTYICSAIQKPLAAFLRRTAVSRICGHMQRVMRSVTRFFITLIKHGYDKRGDQDCGKKSGNSSDQRRRRRRGKIDRQLVTGQTPDE